VVSGVYTGCPFCRLPPDDSRFLELFVACRGNLKELERETGLGYWTLRGRLDDLIRDLGLEHGDTNVTDDRRSILEAVARGEMAVVDAERRLLELSGIRPPGDPGAR
jgi:hypothetical protein